MEKEIQNKRLKTNQRMIAIRLIDILQKKGISNQEFSIMMNKPLPVICKWLVGDYNFNLRLLTKIEAVLGEEILKIGR
jgi:hypothetical protein